MRSKAMYVAAWVLTGSMASPAAWAQRTGRPASRAVVVRTGTSSFLGVGVAEIEADRAKALSLREEHGVEIKSVEPDSGAARAGVKEGDVVLEYNGQKVEGTEQFVRLVRETPVGRQVKLLIWRNGAAQTLTATMGSREPGLLARGGEGLEITLPRIPEIRIPDTPRVFTSWRSGMLGIESESLGSQLAEYFGVKEGVLVRSVMKGSPADKAGLKAGDVITKVEDRKVSGPREVALLLRTLRTKKTFPMTIVRDRKEMTVNVTLDDDSSLREPRRADRPDGFEL